jgi:tripartite-type tricarboxylate transporter receptor subunit TctC
MFDLVMTAAPHIKAGTVVALGTTGAKRSKFLPELPTLAEQGLDDYQVTAWFGLFGPDKLPKPIVEKLNVATNTILARADIQKRLGQLGVEPEMERRPVISLSIHHQACSGPRHGNCISAPGGTGGVADARARRQRS